MTCPHCPDGEPFTDQEALRKHIKWNHEQQHLLHGAELVSIDNLKKKLDHELQHVLNGEDEEGVAGQKGELENSTGSSEGTTTRQKKKWEDTVVSMPTHIQGGNCEELSSPVKLDIDLSLYPSTVGCPKKTKNKNFGMLLSPVVFIG